MELIDFVKKYHISIEEIAYKSRLTALSIRNYIYGKTVPTPRNAARIEKVTNGLVTAEELRKDRVRTKRNHNKPRRDGILQHLETCNIIEIQGL